ncbi:MAG: serine/threonine-protein kinase [Kofleriaceae bacterium]|nr:serine/threonine-protein kinase [Kofleriaceae bacterium]
MGQTFGRYRVTSTLGAGAMGEVYAAVDEVLGREVAVKTLKGHRNGLAARMLDERFRQEARAVASLAHPGVVQVFDIDLTADPPYLVMERVAGPSLKERLEEGPLAVNDLRALGIQIGRALAAAHAQQVIHRDVKPANILAAGPGTWKLADFGVAHVPDSSLTMTGQFIGSPAYAPPEALIKGQSDAEGDVYGLGAVLYQAAAGRWPRLEDKSGALIPIVPPLASLAPHVPADVCALIDRAISNDAAQRPTASQIADALAVTGSHPIAAPPAGLPISTPPSGIAVVAPTPATAMSMIAPTVPVPTNDRPWKRYGVLGALVIVLLAIVAATQGGSGSPGLPTPPPGGTATFNAPPITTEKQAKDWRKVVEHVERGDYREANRKLEEWEDKYGETPETNALGDYLEQHEDEGPAGPPGPRKHGKGKGRGPR